MVGVSSQSGRRRGGLGRARHARTVTVVGQPQSAEGRQGHAVAAPHLKRQKDRLRKTGHRNDVYAYNTITMQYNQLLIVLYLDSIGNKHIGLL